MTKTNEGYSRSSSSLPDVSQNLKSVLCPVCEHEVSDLRTLNTHLDKVHGFSNDETSDYESSRESSIIGLNSMLQEKTGDRHKGKMFKIDTTGWKKPSEGKSVCHKCHQRLGAKYGMINCRKCGELFCLKHCKNAIKLNSKALYDPEDGFWCKCCHNCFVSRKGYNDYGLMIEKTDKYKSIRQLKSEDSQLITLQLENRLVRLINGIIQICLQHENSMFSYFKVRADVSALEKKIVDWKDDQSTIDCSICLEPFGLFMRKHHCRLCGQMVCDDEKSNCSSDIELLNLMSAAPDLPFINITTLRDISKIDLKIRICSQCLRHVFCKRKFIFNITRDLPQILAQYENLHNMEMSIMNLISKFDEALIAVKVNDETRENNIIQLADLRRKLLNTFTIYDRLSTKIINLDVQTNSERKIQQSIASHASAFIEEKMMPLRKIPEVLNPISQPISISKSSDLLFNNLTIAEVKKYREELMVMKEQRFLVEEMLATATKERHFEEATILKNNLAELQQNMDNLESKLGENGFE